MPNWGEGMQNQKLGVQLQLHPCSNVEPPLASGPSTVRVGLGRIESRFLLYFVGRYWGRVQLCGSVWVSLVDTDECYAKFSELPYSTCTRAYTEENQNSLCLNFLCSFLIFATN